MKKNTLLLILLTAYFANAQQQEFHLDFEPGTPSGKVATWNNAFGGTSPVEIITNPDADGTNNSTTTKVLKTTLGEPLTAEFWAGIDNSESQEALGTWKIDMGVTSNLTLTMDINKNYVGTIGIKMATTSNGTTFEIGDQNVDNAVVDEWQTISFDLSGINPVGDLTNISDIIIFVDYTKTNGRVGQPSEYILYIDNVKWHAEKLTDPVVPACDDEIQNGDETGVDCGGACDACPIPVTSLSIDFESATTFIGVDGATYNDMVTNDVTNGINSSANAGQISNCNFGPWSHIQMDITEGIDLSAADKGFSLMVKGPRATPILLKIQVGDDHAISHEVGGNYTTPNQWQKITFDFTPFTTTDRSKIVIFFDITAGASGNTNDDIFLVDDLIFDAFSSLSSTRFEATENNFYPNPTQNNWEIKTKSQIIQSINLSNVLGKKVLSLSPNSNEAKIDGSSLEAGLYFAQIKTNSGINTLKLVKQ
ncbi:T9SS type A sorting domain-containing protein [Seonamhaeicola maritimus]|uniref:T9SS type A sorting domain-containing protein n=1 Tax=Seonamhaeicola maritimus TaxID=2591822 RepID=UPI00249425A1|nr:T9SS type A sorting domain-containing protein [Seonamhaeicola maritimus]